MIYRNIRTGIFVKLAAESDGYFGDFGLEYWQIESPEKSWNYIGSYPISTSQLAIEKSPEWVKIL